MENNNINNEKLLLEIDSLENENGATTKIKNNKIGLIIFIILLIGLSVLYFGNYNNLFENIDEEYSDEEILNYMSKEENAKNKFEEQKNNIIIKNTLFSKNKELMAIISNNNSEAITDLKVEVVFYNGENKIVEIDSAILGIVEKDTEAYVKFLNTPEEFERYEFFISKDYYWYDNLEYVTNQISYEIVDNRDFKNLVVKNNSSKDISEVDFQIVYYDENNTVIDVENAYVEELKKNRTQTRKIYLDIWDNKTYNKIEYNRYEINLLGAYIY